MEPSFKAPELAITLFMCLIDSTIVASYMWITKLLFVLHRWLRNVPVILLLNKYDLLETKVLDGHFKIETYFPEYSTYQLPIDSDCES